MFGKTTHIIFCFLLIINIGCMRQLEEFTPKEMDRIKLTGVNLSSVQYYNSDEIILERVLESADAKTIKGVVVFRNGRYVDRVRISKNTPGILVDKDGDGRIWIAFEDGPLQRLPFEKPKYYGNYFSISPDRMENGKSFVEYDGVEYRIMGRSRLLYRPFERRKTDSDYRSAKGMRVDDSIFNLDRRPKKRKREAQKKDKPKDDTTKKNYKEAKDKHSRKDGKVEDKVKEKRKRDKKSKDKTKRVEG